MNETEWITKLARQAGTGAPQSTDVTSRVIASLRTRPHPRTNDNSVWTSVAITGCILAAITTYIASNEWNSFSNPLGDLNATNAPISNSLTVSQ